MVRSKLFKDAVFVLAAIALLVVAFSLQSCSDASASGRRHTSVTTYGVGLDSVVRVRICFSNEITYLRLTAEERKVLRCGDVVFMNTIDHNTQGTAATVKAVVDKQVP